MKRAAKTTESYLRLPYTMRFRRYADGTYFADVAELQGCMTEADTAEDALKMIKDAMAGWLEVALSEGLPIPEPAVESEYSGRFLVRAPKSLHRDLVQRARAEGASLNQFVVTTLGRAIGATAAPQARALKRGSRERRVKQRA